MGIVLCEKHGHQFFYEVCKHHYEAILAGESSKAITTGILQLKICTNCYAKYEYEEIEGLTVDKVLELPEKDADFIEKRTVQKYNAVDRKIICVKCYEEASILL